MNAESSLRAWIVVAWRRGGRLRVNKDIRKVIGKMIWARRINIKDIPNHVLWKILRDYIETRDYHNNCTYDLKKGPLAIETMIPLSQSCKKIRRIMWDHCWFGERIFGIF